MNEKKVFLIKYGPPASGKGSCLKKFYDTAKAHGFDENKFIDINVDDVVSKLDVNNEIKSDAKAYWKFRPEANEITDRMLKDGLKEGKSSIILETTGNSLDKDWLIKDIVIPAREYNYKIVVVYPLVDQDSLIERSLKRAKEIGRSPDPDKIKEAVVNASRNIGKMFGIVDNIVLFDNTTETPCGYKILECDKYSCKVNFEWVVKKAILDMFGLNMNLEETNIESRSISNDGGGKTHRKSRRSPRKSRRSPRKTRSVRRKSCRKTRSVCRTQRRKSRRRTRRKSRR